MNRNCTGQGAAKKGSARSGTCAVFFMGSCAREDTEVHFCERQKRGINLKKENEKKRGLSRQAKTNLVGYSFILPNIIGVCAFTLFPMLFSLIISFTDWDYMKGIGNWNFIGIKNFITMWSDEWFTSALTNTLIFVVGAPIGLQTPSAPWVLSLAPPLGVLCSIL